MPPDLTDEQREQAVATANLVAASMARLNREHGKAAVLEAMRLISSAMESDQWRKDVGQALIDNGKILPE
ncbi:hypothetical protein [Rhizobium halophytocola]|uniref:Uncharacterized protein n=1 Tax=Rhizobium halophytocola TaxID=735519 RepID=A0ABS4DYL9_9HYPH|nr:hypothetical protein [Rhizobium halophytocola]MBP1850781.1 hypothetical protein [Rhizobium halophytocola]